MHRSQLLQIAILAFAIPLIAQNDLTDQSEETYRKHCCGVFIPGPQGPQGPSGSDATNVDYLFAYSTIAEAYSATPPAFQNISFNDVPIINGWTHPNFTDFVCPANGIYQVSYRVSAFITTAETFFWIAAFFNGIQLPGSDASSQIASQQATSLAGSFLFNGVVGQILNLAFLIPGGQLFAFPPYAPTTAEINIERIV